MNTLLAVLEFQDYAFIAAIVAIFAGGAAYTGRQEINLQLIERQLKSLQQKMDALLKHSGVELPTPPPSGLSSEIEFLASNLNTKIAAIKRYREENPGTGLAEAKNKIEAFYQNSLKG